MNLGISRPHKNLKMESIPNDPKSYQKTIVEYTKASDLRGIVDCVSEIALLQDLNQTMMIPAKMAVNISASLLVSVGPDSDRDLIIRLHESVGALVHRLPSLGELESVEYSFAKIKLSLGLLDSVLLLANESKEPRLRMFSAIMEYCGVHALYTTSVRVLENLSDRGLSPTETEYSYVINSMRDLSKAEFSTALVALLDRVSDTVDTIESPLLLAALTSSLISRGIVVHDDVVIPSSPDSDLPLSKCPITGIVLDRFELTPSELDEMLELTRRLVVESGVDGEDVFNRLILGLEDKQYSVFLDGANIAHTNQNFDKGYFRFDQIAEVLDHFEKAHSCLVVLHSKWTNPKKDLRLNPPHISGPKRKKRPALPPLGSAVVVEEPIIEVVAHDHTVETEGGVLPPMDLIDSWRTREVLLEVPHKQNDDWFWMHACCLAIQKNKGHEILLVSNDQMRDHFWRMHTPKFFKTFYRNHVCRYSIRFDGESENPKNYYTFSMPLPHTIAIQRHGNFFHVPYKKDDQVKWIVFELDRS
jgi:hypothetical protein